MTIPTEYYRVIRREPALVCYWRLNDTSGTRAIDWAGKFNINGIYDGSPISDVPLIWNDSLAGSKLFGVENQNIEVPNAVPLQITGDIAIELWINSLLANQTCSILGKMNGAFTFPEPYHLSMENGKIVFSLGNGINKVSITSSVIPSFSPVHIMVTSFRKNMKIFIDGKENVSGTLGSQEVKDGGNPIFIGELGNNSSGFNGMIGEIALYSGGMGLANSRNHFGIGRQIIYDLPYYSTYDPPSYS